MKVVMHKGYKFKLKPNKEQTILINKNIGCARKMYNLLLADKIEYYKENGIMLNRTPAYYKTLEEYKYLKEVDSLALTNAQRNLEKAYKNFFEKRSGFPKFHKKGTVHDKYTTNMVNENIKLNGNMITLPKIGEVRFIKHREIPAGCKIKSCTISKSAGEYYISIKVEYEAELIMEEKTNLPIEECIAFDYSSPHFFIDSNNYIPEVMRFYREAEPKLAKLQKQLSKKVKGSNNYKKQQVKLQKAHKKVANKRDDSIQKLSTLYVKAYSVLIFEDINLRDMSRTLNLGKSTMDNGFGKFRVLCEQKASREGKYFVKVNKWYPSSKTCHSCGYVNKSLTLNDREWTCPICGELHSRDYNAALNLLAEGYRVLLSS